MCHDTGTESILESQEFFVFFFFSGGSQEDELLEAEEFATAIEFLSNARINNSFDFLQREQKSFLSLSLFGFLSIFSPALKFEELVTLIRMDYFHSIPTQVLLLLPFLHISMDDFSTNFYGSDGKKRREEKKKKRFID